MVDSVDTSSKTQARGQYKTSTTNFPLITKERTQQLELLNHLVDNLAHSIVVCGPQGIGKTRLLFCLKEIKPESRIYCWLKGDSRLSLERIQEILSETMGKAIPGINLPSLSNAFERLERRESKVILIIDDAGDLAPGLIESIIEYAQDKPVLRVIFALTHSELYLKTGTDASVDNCYHIDIPALTELQCGDFLEYLATLPSPRIQYNAINENRIAELYRKSHGIPGNILTELPEINYKKADYAKAILVSAVAGLVLIALGVQWWSSRQKAESDVPVVSEKSKVSNKPSNNSLAAVKPVNTVPVVSAPVAVTPQVSGTQALPKPPINAENVAANKPVETTNATSGQSGSNNATVASSVTPVNEITPSAQATNVDQEDTAVSAQVQSNPTVSATQEGHWLMEQPAQNLTLQLMALSTEQPIIEVLQRYQGLGQNLRYLKTKTRAGRDRFVLLYGSFATIEEANIEKQKLPKELRQTWLRKIEAIQKEMNPGFPMSTSTSTSVPITTATDTSE